MAQTWPKGPFPERYRFEATRARVSAATVALDAWLPGESVSGRQDPLVSLVPGDVHAVRGSLARSGVEGTAFRWLGLEGESVPTATVGVVASNDPIDAVVVVGVAGPSCGLGNAGVVRFLVGLRTHARFELDGLGEARLEMSIAPHGPQALQAISERIVKIHRPSVSAGKTASAWADEIITTGRLELAWP